MMFYLTSEGKWNRQEQYVKPIICLDISSTKPKIAQKMRVHFAQNCMPNAWGIT